MRFWRICLATTALVPLASQPVWANPLDGTVVGGAASISGTGTSQVTVTQTTDRAAIDWQSFNIGVGETTRFIQPSAQSVILNRVVGGQDASRIYGTLQANGTVYLVNPDGILFGPSAVVDTGSFLATTHGMGVDDFMAGHDRFTTPANPYGSIVNEGSISVRDEGFAALVAPGVRNDGVIAARLGTVALSTGGSGFTLDLRGDELINFAVSDAISGDVTDVKTGESLKNLVENTGTIKADGGRVELTAASARKVVDSVINNRGVIEANTVGTRGGKIVLGAATKAKKAVNTPLQVVRNSGTLSASGKRAGEKGGTVVMTGEAVGLESATIDASGYSGGGKILIGGDYHGGEPVENQLIPFESFLIPTADYVYSDAATTIDASATGVGDGGKVILWGNQGNYFDASIYSKGGALGGNGGFVEVSSPYRLSFLGGVDTRADLGVAGQLLLDPHSLIIGDTQSPISPYTPGGIGEFSNSLMPNLFGPDTTSYLSTATIEQAMLTISNLWIFMTSPDTHYGMEGSVFINKDIVAPSNNSSLTILSASNFQMSVYLNATVDFSNSTGTFQVGLGNTTPAVALYAGAGGKIIGNTGNVYLTAYTVGTASNPIPVEVLPDDDATAANYVACANRSVCSDTGTRIGVLDAYTSDPDAFRNNVFVSVSLRPGYIFTPTPPVPPTPAPTDGINDLNTVTLAIYYVRTPVFYSEPSYAPKKYGTDTDEQAQISTLAEALRKKREAKQNTIIKASNVSDVLLAAPDHFETFAELIYGWLFNYGVNKAASQGQSPEDVARVMNEKADKSVNPSYNPDAAAESIEWHQKLGIKDYY